MEAHRTPVKLAKKSKAVKEEHVEAVKEVVKEVQAEPPVVEAPVKEKKVKSNVVKIDTIIRNLLNFVPEADKKAAVESVNDFVSSNSEFKCKRKHRVKDPNEPKKPLSSYMLFATEHRSGVIAKLKEQNNGVDPRFEAITKELGKLWGDCTEEAKNKYVELHKQKKEEYVKVLADYKASKGETPEPVVEKKQRKKAAPK